MSIYAIIQDGKVGILLDWDGKGDSPLPDQTLIEVQDGVSCNIGDYYNPSDSLFYIDEKFTQLSGYEPPITVDVAYETASTLISANASSALDKIKAPLPVGDYITWIIMGLESENWIKDNKYNAELLLSMVSASGNSWSISDLASSTQKNHSVWKGAAGEIMGEARVKKLALSSLKGQVLTGKKKVDELVNFDTAIAAPDVTYEDMFDE